MLHFQIKKIFPVKEMWLLQKNKYFYYLSRLGDCTYYAKINVKVAQKYIA